MNDPILTHWRNYWDQRAASTPDAFECVRGSTVRVPEIWQNAFEARIREFCGDLSGLAVLDAGCGVGDLFRLLDLRGARQYVGSDLSPEILKRFHSSQEEWPCPIDLVEASVTDLPFEDRTFDLVVCRQVLHYLDPEHQVEAIRELGRVLAPGGRLLLIAKNASSWYAWRSPLDRAKRLVKRFIGRAEPAASHVYQPFDWYASQLESMGKLELATSMGWWRPSHGKAQICRLAEWEGRVAMRLPALHRRFAKKGIEAVFGLRRAEASDG